MNLCTLILRQIQASLWGCFPQAQRAWCPLFKPFHDDALLWYTWAANQGWYLLHQASISCFYSRTNCCYNYCDSIVYSLRRWYQLATNDNPANTPSLLYIRTYFSLWIHICCCSFVGMHFVWAKPRRWHWRTFVRSWVRPCGMHGVCPSIGTFTM